MSAQVKSYVKGQGGVGRGARDEGRRGRASFYLGQEVWGE